MCVILVLVAGYEVTLTAGLTVERGSDLQGIIDFARDGDTLYLGAKAFEATPRAFTDPLCGNCQDTRTPVRASYGFIIKDKALVIIGRDRNQTRLVTNGGYGVYFENSQGSVIKNLTVTGGKRDPDGNATDAGIVVRNSKVLIERVDILDNDHRIDSVVVGIGGIFGREGAEITAVECDIVNNGWDGVALYRGAFAMITDCLIKEGRGAGIGVTWDATCVAYRNEVSGYWKGIGSFGTSIVIARNNLVHENLGWGIIATGQSTLDAVNNVVHRNGNCGVAPWSTESRGKIINNIISENGWRDQWVCPCVGVWNYGDWAKWKFDNNIVWNNKDGEYRDIWDQSGIHGNLNVDPLFVGEGDFNLREGSPAINAGDSLIFNIDGTTSHIGLYGGPQARSTFRSR
ncbi:MAG: right-handed parallel beta-helix repeat-containing protein [candidate division Zixibacteria bacterium]|nr:right-handed parallel beta-helix repeat-containing protein [candidate division Zixibacteria bacterium]